MLEYERYILLVYAGDWSSIMEGTVWTLRVIASDARSQLLVLAGDEPGSCWME
jgi:hypothetical protein